MELSKIKAFFYAAKSKSFSGTKLLTSPSVINRHVQDLENQFNLKLFFRTNKGLVLTKPGEFLFKETEDIIEKLKTIE